MIIFNAKHCSKFSSDCHVSRRGLREFVTSLCHQRVSHYCFRRGISCYLFNFELEYKEGEESTNSSECDYLDDTHEQCFGHLVTLDWFKCLNCTTATLNHLWESPPCKEIPEV